MITPAHHWPHDSRLRWSLVYDAPGMIPGLPKAVFDAVLCIYTVIFSVIRPCMHIHQVPDPDQRTLYRPTSQPTRGTGSLKRLQQRGQPISSYIRTLVGFARMSI